MTNLVLYVFRARNAYGTKFAKSHQTQFTSNFKNIKEKFLKTNAAIWFNKICENYQLSPTYIKIKVSGDNKRSCDARKLALKYRLCQELTFLYLKE